MKKITELPKITELSNEELFSRARAIVAEVRRITAQVLAHLQEVECRKLYLQYRCTSLFEFCQRELGYSESEAFTRISAMRLSREVPEVVQAIESGKLSLTNRSKAQSFFRHEKKTGRPVSVEEKRHLLQEIEGLSTRECEKKLVSAGDELQTFSRTFKIDSEIESNLRRIRELWGNQDLADTELLRKMTKLVLSRIDPMQKSRERKVKALVVPKNLSELALPPEFDTPNSRYIPTRVRRTVWQRDQG